MIFASPSATLEKKDDKDQNLPNVIKITNRSLDETAEDGIKFEIPAAEFEYPQAENDEDRIQLCGGAENALKVFNKMLATDALSLAKTKIRIAASGSKEEIVASAKLACKNFTYVEETTLTAAEAKNRVSELRAIAARGDLTNDELAAMFKKSLGL